MKKLLSLATVLLLCLSLWGCSAPAEHAQIAATTLPVYEFTLRLCEGTGLTVTRLVTESVSCLHDYSLNVRQVQAAEAAEVTVLSGGGLEEFMEDILSGQVIDASAGIELIECEEDHDHDHEHGHSHEEDPHFWLSPANAKIMAQNICAGLCDAYPEYREEFEKNLLPLLSDLDALEQYGKQALSDLSCRELITFHDGFAYFAQAFGLTVLKAVEEESGREASAQELIELIELAREHGLPAIFTETNGSTSAARIICAETGAKVYTLDMAMSGDSYLEAMYHNIDIIKEALE
ncbi:MAG: metal ABC transporter substrate-binding protein [Faecousia sp.]